MRLCRLRDAPAPTHKLWKLQSCIAAATCRQSTLVHCTRHKNDLFCYPTDASKLQVLPQREIERRRLADYSSGQDDPLCQKTTLETSTIQLLVTTKLNFLSVFNQQGENGSVGNLGYQCNAVGHIADRYRQCDAETRVRAQQPPRANLTSEPCRQTLLDLAFGRHTTHDTEKLRVDLAELSTTIAAARDAAKL